MPNSAVIHIQKRAPGPPRRIAKATPAILPIPIVAERAADKAWKWVTSPSSFGLSYFPETTSKLCFNLRNCMKPNDTVINRPVPIKIIVRGRDIHPLNISVQ